MQKCASANFAACFDNKGNKQSSQGVIQVSGFAAGTSKNEVRLFLENLSAIRKPAPETLQGEDGRPSAESTPLSLAFQHSQKSGSKVRGEEHAPTKLRRGPRARSRSAQAEGRHD